MNDKSKYITKHTKCNSWHLRKQINGKTVSFGSYDSFERAVEMRDYFESKGWENCLNERLSHTKKSRNVEYHAKTNTWRPRKMINGEIIQGVTCYNLEDALKEVELLNQVNWDLDALCEGIDETDNGEIKFLEGVKFNPTFEKQKYRTDEFWARKTKLYQGKGSLNYEGT